MKPPAPARPERPIETVVLPARGWRIDPGHALTAAATCWIGFALIVAAVLSDRAAEFDAAGLRLWRTGTDLHPRGADWLTEAVRDYTALGGVLLRHIVGIGALIALLFLRLRREAVLLALTLLLSPRRVWLGVHYPSDAIAGWLGGAGWAFLASALLYRPAKVVAEKAEDKLEAVTPGGVR